VTAERSPFDAVDLVVWSGTGNSRHVAERIAEAARSRGTVARVLTATGAATGAAGAISTVADEHPATRRLLGLLAPTHGFTAAWPLVKMALTLPGVRGTDTFVLVTRGGTRVAGKTLSGFEGTAAYLPAALLALRGARVRGVGAIDMPLNWTVIVPSGRPEGVAAVVERGDAQTDRFSSRVLDGETVLGGRGRLVLGVLILPLSLGYLLIARLLLAKTFFADERCTSCGTCEKDCPQGAVRLRGRARRPYWTFDCQNCMRCMSNCPTDAIQGAQAWLLLYIGLMTVPVASLAATALLRPLGISGGIVRGVVRLLAGFAWIVAAVWGAYALLWLGLLVPGLRFVLARATLTRRYRRYRGPDGRG
jgi:Pyruvate/2-oxoacid:ferredoxin oxidoreductase delta subunit